jgi:hypothetical protein
MDRGQRARGDADYRDLFSSAVSAPVIDLGTGQAKYYAFDDDKFLQGLFKVLASGNSLDAVILEAKKKRRRFRLFQHNPAL